MDNTSLSHLSNDVVLRELKSLVGRDHQNTAELIAHLAEVARRRLFRPAGYPSMFKYCVHELRMSEGVAYRRIRAARVVRQFPHVLDAIAEGRLHLDAVKLLSPHLRTWNVEELVNAATHKSSQEVELLIAARFPKQDVPTVVRPVSQPTSPAPESPGAVMPSSELAARRVPSAAPATQDSRMSSSKGALEVDGRSQEPDADSEGQPEAVSRQVRLSAPHPRVAPLAPGRFALQVTIGQDAHDLLRRAQELLAHSRPGCDIAQVLELALTELVQKLEKRKFADTDAPRARRSSGDSRNIPAEVRRRVAERDGKQCTFVSDTGVRCAERALLEFDHELPVARGGRSTVANVRLRCRAHNQLAAEQVYGEGFMHEKRDLARAQRCEPPAEREPKVSPAAS